MALSFASATASFASRSSLNSISALACATTREILARTPFCSVLPMNRLSVCIITLNEEGNLSRALASLKEIADEIVVVDCGSTDRTAENARETVGASFERSWTNFADQKNYAAECASGDWIFSMDADEELSSPLQTSLLAWKKHTPEYCVYEASRKAFYLGAWIEHSGCYPYFQRRLYRRNEAEFSGIVHESLRYAGKVGRLSGDLLH